MMIRTEWVAAYRGLLADTRPARRAVAPNALRLGRVRHPPPEPAQDRRPRRREGRPHPHPLPLGLSRHLAVRHAGGAARHLGVLTAEAACTADGP